MTTLSLQLVLLLTLAGLLHCAPAEFAFSIEPTYNQPQTGFLIVNTSGDDDQVDALLYDFRFSVPDDRVSLPCSAGGATLLIPVTFSGTMRFSFTFTNGGPITSGCSLDVFATDDAGFGLSSDTGHVLAASISTLGVISAEAFPPATVAEVPEVSSYYMAALGLSLFIARRRSSNQRARDQHLLDS